MLLFAYIERLSGLLYAGCFLGDFLCMVDTIRTRREIQCLLYAGFFVTSFFIENRFEKKRTQENASKLHVVLQNKNIKRHSSFFPNA